MIRWIPGSEDLFIAIFSNGTALIMDRERDDQSFIIPEASSWEKSEFHAVRPHRSSKYNPVSFWKVSERGLTDIAFAPDGVHLAITGVDGQLRIIDYRNERLTDIFCSYYGKLSCVDWSPDGRYILTGGEDDLVTLWSFNEKKMVARCQGHKSWVTGVAFDRWRCDAETYRFGSVGEDCNLVLWDFSYSALQKPKHPRTTIPTTSTAQSLPPPTIAPVAATTAEPPVSAIIPSPTFPNQMERKKSLRNHRLFRGFSSSDSNTNSSNPLFSTSSGNGSSFNRFRKRSSRSSNIFNNTGNDYHDEVLSGDAFQQHAPVMHPVVKKSQAAILLPTTVRTIHSDPCLSLTFKENTLITTDRRGKIRTWGRPQG
ncbi:WD40-repeat-containing domain protein [Mycotypha africana]|uniref:WD40-repeat-containing domain protein n=1 Tax=Mycotypha africana TaxID=64632 RepID=UPI0023015FF7|nr:WD40-repeat-containing domain protein [Mycotypha africana]KAI8987650.1 WD40-repeat-containing domain protein [Mycotypha africana]